MAIDPTTTGGCLCGKVRYRMTGPVRMCVACHCKNCQRQAGSALSVVIGLDEDAIEITGTVKTYRDKGETGGDVWRQFCGDCGSPLFTIADAAPGMKFIKAGTLDDTSALRPAFHCYTKSKQDWLTLGDLPHFAEMPPEA